MPDAPRRGPREISSKRDTHPRWMTLEEVEEALCLGRSKRTELPHGGMLPCFKVTGRWGSLRPEVGEWMRRKRDTPASREEWVAHQRFQQVARPVCIDARLQSMHGVFIGLHVDG